MCNEINVSKIHKNDLEFIEEYCLVIELKSQWDIFLDILQGLKILIYLYILITFNNFGKIRNLINN